jgi:hypothetical protein
MSTINDPQSAINVENIDPVATIASDDDFTALADLAGLFYTQLEYRSTQTFLDLHDAVSSFTSQAPELAVRWREAAWLMVEAAISTILSCDQGTYNRALLNQTLKIGVDRHLVADVLAVAGFTDGQHPARSDARVPLPLILVVAMLSAKAALLAKPNHLSAYPVIVTVHLAELARQHTQTSPRNKDDLALELCDEALNCREPEDVAAMLLDAADTLAAPHQAPRHYFVA